MSEGYQSRIISELIETEKSYLRQIEILQTYFTTPILEKGLLPSHVHSAIFGQLSAIYRMNSNLFEEISNEEEKIGSAFLKFGPFLKVYSSYAKNFLKANTILQEWESNNEPFRSFLRITETRPEVQTKLISLLITPIQRIPRYRLLLEELQKCFNSSSSIYADIQGALKKVNEAAKHINQSVADSQSVHRLLALQKALKNQQPSIIVPGRKLLKEGVLNKVSRKGKGSQARMFFLFSDMLLYTKLPQTNSGAAAKTSDALELKPNSLECCCVLPLRHCRVTTLFGSDDQGITFRLQCSDEDLLLYIESSSAGQEWIVAIKEAAQEALKKRKTLRKKSSRRKAVRKPPLRNIVWSEDSSPPKMKPKKKDILSSPKFVSDLLSKKEAFKFRLRNARDCLTPPRKPHTPKSSSENKSQMIDHSSSIPLSNQPYSISTTPYYNDSENRTVSGSNSSIRRRQPLALSPLATTSWNPTCGPLQACSTPLIYRDGVRGKVGSSVTPERTLSPSPGQRTKKRPLSEILSPAWSRRKFIKKELI